MNYFLSPKERGHHHYILNGNVLASAQVGLVLNGVWMLRGKVQSKKQQAWWPRWFVWVWHDL
jgi:hypothetical protein